MALQDTSSATVCVVYQRGVASGEVSSRWNGVGALCPRVGGAWRFLLHSVSSESQMLSQSPRGMVTFVRFAVHKRPAAGRRISAPLR
jgi:hypothetical protein